jgi:hypothetical protein
MKPVQAVTAPLEPATGPGWGPLFNSQLNSLIIARAELTRRTYAQKRLQFPQLAYYCNCWCATYGQYPGSTPPLPPSWPTSSQVCIYGDLTAGSQTRLYGVIE